eukprot:g6192.t1
MKAHSAAGASQFMLRLRRWYNAVADAVARQDAVLARRHGLKYTRVRTFLLAFLRIATPVWLYLWVGAFLGAIEGWSFSESMYFSTMTLLTVGFGDLSPMSRQGRIFAIFYIPMALGILFATINRLAELKMKFRGESLSIKQLTRMDEDNDGKISEPEFIRAMLRRAGFNRLVLDVMKQQFEALDTDGDGFLEAKDLDILDDALGREEAALAGSTENDGAPGHDGADVDASGLELEPPPNPLQTVPKKLVV